MIWRSGDYILTELKDYISNLKHTIKILTERNEEQEKIIKALKKEIELLKEEKEKGK